MNFILPARRNSRLYETRIYLNYHLFYKKRQIRYGKKNVDGTFLYLFNDLHLMLEENTTLYKKRS